MKQDMTEAVAPRHGVRCRQQRGAADLLDRIGQLTRLHELIGPGTKQP